MILQLRDGSSRGGYHETEYALRCARKADWHKRDRERQRAEKLLLHMNNMGTHVGTLCHELVQAWHRHDLERDDILGVEFEMANGRPLIIDYATRTEADRIAMWYTMALPRELGINRGMELQLSAMTPSPARKVNGVKQTARDILDRALHKDYDGILDWLIEVKPKHVKNWAMAPLNTDLRPGMYVLDWKFEMARWANSNVVHTNSLQRVGYMAALRALLPKNKIMGALTMCVIKVKNPDVIVHLQPPPSEAEIKAIRVRRAALNVIQQHLKGVPFGNEGECLGAGRHGGPCEYFLSMECTRS